MISADRITGCIVGGAIGDALGNPYEGQRGPVRVDFGDDWRFSDDTQLTLATCEAVTETRAVTAASIAKKMAEWFRDGRITGLGASTFKALSELNLGGHWALVGRKGEMAAGNGAAMRIAPLAFCLNPESGTHRQTIRDVCRITHHNDEAYAGALVVITAIRMAAQDKWTGKRNMICHVADTLPDSRVRDRMQEVAQMAETASLADIALEFGCSGYVVETVPLALCGALLFESRGFDVALMEIVSVGGDTDTIAAIAGQIMGAACGRKSLPDDLINRLPDRSLVEKTASAFAATVKSAFSPAHP